MGFNASGTLEELQEQIYRVVEKIYVEREQEFGDDFHRFCQVRYLATIDQLWKDHLLAMDHLRQGIGLRGYGQKDPKQEYKKEGYEGFIQMLAAIKQGFVSQFMRVQRSTSEDTARLQRMMRQRQRNVVESRGGEDGKAEPAVAAPRQAVVRQGPKAGRNDPCPCGSGKKYKKCCGAVVPA